MNILDEIVHNKKKQINLEKNLKSIDELMMEIENEVFDIRNFYEALNNTKDIAIISEIKKASPSKGIIKDEFDIEETVKAYEKENFHAYSVLTESKYFLGKDSYISKVKSLTNRPVLRKDFIVDEYQIYQTKLIGADAILLIASVLKSDLKAFYNIALKQGLYPIVEIHSESEIKYIEEADPYLIGINNRNLETFQTDIKHTERLMKVLPEDRFIISESGIKNKEDLEYLKNLGVRGALIGESLMRNLSEIEKVF